MSDQVGVALIQPAERVASGRAAQDLFEHIAGNLQSLPNHASPGSLGRRWVDDLQGLMERFNKNRSVSQTALDDLGGVQTSSQLGMAADQAPRRAVPDREFKRLLAALQAVQDTNLGIVILSGTIKKIGDGVQMLVKG